VLRTQVSGLQTKLEQLVIKLEEESNLRGHFQILKSELEAKVTQLTTENVKQAQRLDVLEANMPIAPVNGNRQPINRKKYPDNNKQLKDQEKRSMYATVLKITRIANATFLLQDYHLHLAGNWHSWVII